jgi:hypothetical protein
MTTVIAEPGLAKTSIQDKQDVENALRQVTNELQRVRHRLRQAQLKLAGLQALKKDLRLYLQPGDYEHILDVLRREVERREHEEKDLAYRRHREYHRLQLMGGPSRPPSWGRGQG